MIVGYCPGYKAVLTQIGPQWVERYTLPIPNTFQMLLTTDAANNPVVSEASKLRSDFIRISNKNQRVANSLAEYGIRDLDD